MHEALVEPFEVTADLPIAIRVGDACSSCREHSAWHVGDIDSHFRQMAEGVGVPELDTFSACVAEAGPVPAILADEEITAEIGATGTPTF